MTDIFTSALAQLESSDLAWVGPQVFVDYCNVHGIRGGRTQARISVQAYRNLHPALREAHVMVFRLGTPAGKAQFALVRAVKNVRAEFFLADAECFDFGAPPVEHLDLGIREHLHAFKFMGTVEESGAVNLAIASGLLGHALGVDEPSPRVAPTTGASTYTFAFRPHAAHDVEWTHEAGQVEVDAIWLARRGGRPTLFVIEAKHGPPGRLLHAPGGGLAKHKLAYPYYFARAKNTAGLYNIVPVYIRSWVERHSNRILFGVAECGFRAGGHESVSSLEGPASPSPVFALPSLASL